MTVRVGLVGFGNIGKEHAKLLQSDTTPGLELTAVCASTVDLDDVAHYKAYEELLAAKVCDAIVIATPTLDHPEKAKLALAQEYHVLVEKPVAMSVEQAEGVIAAVPDGQICGVMLNQRHHPVFAKIKALLDLDVIGPIVRYQWTMTAWYRPDIYYQVSTWRGTWPGEGGGLLINQCIHNLDVLQWWLGLPSAINAHVGFGKYHDIEVEDEVSAYFEHEDGVTGTLVASSGEAPGINSLDIIGDRGMLRFDGEVLKLWTRDTSVAQARAETRDMFDVPEFMSEAIEIEPTSSQHANIFNNFADAVEGKADLATPIREGLGSLQLANGILLSAWQNRKVAVPIDHSAYEAALQSKISSTQLRTPLDVEVNIDMEKSYR